MIDRSRRRRRFIGRAPRFRATRRLTTDRGLRESPFYWWWRYLKHNDEYIACCGSGGKGRLAKLYEDFGDVRADGPEAFRKWWRKHGEFLFAEPALPLPMQDVGELSKLTGIDLRDYMVVVVPLDIEKRRTKRYFGELLDRRHARPRGGDQFARSKAPYRLATKPVALALEKTLRIYEMWEAEQLKEKTIRMPLWRIGEVADLARALHVSRDDAPKVAAAKKMKMTVIVSRYRAHARSYIANTGKGVFPKK